MYLTREMARSAVYGMANFYSVLRGVYSSHGMDVQDDLGRRNILMSKPQEKYFADQLAKTYPSTKTDGTTGQPDISIPEISRELECKITSAHKTGAWRLQTDYVTLRKKGSLDYLYVLCDEDFKKFAVLHFENLTVDDFNLPGKGSRNKANMNIERAMQKCHVLLGSHELAAAGKIKAIEEKLLTTPSTRKSAIRQLNKSLETWKSRKAVTFKLEAII